MAGENGFAETVPGQAGPVTVDVRTPFKLRQIASALESIDWSEVETIGTETAATFTQSLVEAAAELEDDRDDWYPCDRCGAGYRHRSAALRCCTDSAITRGYLP